MTYECGQLCITTMEFSINDHLQTLRNLFYIAIENRFPHFLQKAKIRNFSDWSLEIRV